MKAVSQLVSELDELRNMNVQVENDQINLVEQLTTLSLDHQQLVEEAESTRLQLDESK